MASAREIGSLPVAIRVIGAAGWLVPLIEIARLAVFMIDPAQARTLHKELESKTPPNKYRVIQTYKEK